MAESHLEQAPLAHLGLAARAVSAPGDAGVGLAAMPVRPMLSLRGEGDDSEFLAAAERGLGFALPTAPNTTAGRDGSIAFWLGPSEWLIAGPCPRDGIAAALAQVRHALVDVSDARAVLRLTGPQARNLLAQGTGLDLHDRAFPAGACAQSTMALADMLLHRPQDDAAAGAVFELYVGRSYADYLWRWLEAAADEYGFAVLAPAEDELTATVSHP